MQILDPSEVMRNLNASTASGVAAMFPIVGKKNVLYADNVYVDGDKDVDDIHTQRTARLAGRTWSSAVRADLRLVDAATGKVLDSKKGMKLANIPQITRRYSFIVDGSEYQVDNQWRLKSGVYARRKATGEIESQFNLAKGRGFRLSFDPTNKSFFLTYKTSNIKLYPVLKALGASDADIERSWGKSILDHNASASDKGELRKLGRALSVKDVDGLSEDGLVAAIRAAYNDTVLREDTTAITLGKPYSKVSAASLLAASDKVLDINKGNADVDNRDALKFKELWSVDDFIPERVANSAKMIQRKVRNNLDRRDSIDRIVGPDVFGVPIKAFFTSTSLSQQSTQVNPLNMVGGHLRTTLTGNGGADAQAITFDAKLVDPSHMGFLDPVHTPEGETTGITLHLVNGIGRKGRDVAATFYNMKTGKMDILTPAEVSSKNIAFPDQFVWDSKGPRPVSSGSITVMTPDEKNPKTVSLDKVDYVIPSAKRMFSMTANMVPFLPSDQANRAEMATRHLEQAISLKEREAPFVQSATGSTDAHKLTHEKIVGSMASHQSPVDGTVVKVTRDMVQVRGQDGKVHDIQLYTNYPLNDKKAFIDSIPTVRVGDKVQKRQTVADTSFTKDGVLALGRNLRIGYLPYKGLVFEDGIVISETAAKKLTSEHLNKERTYVEDNMTLGLRRFRQLFPGVVSDANASKLDDDGVIKVGSVVDPGDTIVTAMQKVEPSREQILLAGISKALYRPFKDRSQQWDKDYSGVVTDVVKNGREVTVFIKTESAADIGDKLSGRHGNKGVISAVIPDAEMPRNAEGEPLDIIVNPSGVPGRINLGQVLETMLGKVAHEKGGTFNIDNFEQRANKKIVHVAGHYRTIKATDGTTKEVWVAPHDREIGYQELVDQIMKENKVTPTEELFDPTTGKSLGQVMTGYQYILKHMHTIDKKLRARSHGYGNEYDASMIPRSGGDSGAQKFGGLGTFAMLAHGATANLREGLTWKSDKTQDAVWTALQSGQVLPAPKTTFAYSKFVSYLNALGLNVDKHGDHLVLSPLTDKELRRISNGELVSASRVIRGKDLKPEKGGLFDPEVTGGTGGKNWSHISLSEPMPNPMFEQSIASLLGLTGKDYTAVVNGESGFDAKGNVVPLNEAEKVGLRAIVERLSELNVKEELDAALARLKVAKGVKLDKENKRVKYLRMLEANGLTAEEAYVIRNLPVLPPVFRPITLMEGGDLNVDGLNGLYRDVALLNEKAKETQGVLPDKERAALTASVYDAVAALYGSAPASVVQSGMLQDGTARPPGIIPIISGSSPKFGFFQQKVMDRKQDLTMRSVIVPDMHLHLDEIGLPRTGAMEIFRPFVVRELVKMGKTPLEARDEITKNTKLANRALEVVVETRPVLFKRDPVLHKFGIMGFYVRLHDESAIHIHPLVTGGFNADFDGDTMGVFVPVSNEAVEEAKKMLPSNNLFNTATGGVMYQPTLEGQLGLHLLTQYGASTDKKFASGEDAVKAAKAGSILFTDVVYIGDKRTTAGRWAFNQALPASLRRDEYLTDADKVMDRKNLNAVLTDLAKNKPTEFRDTIDKIKDLGFGHAYDIGFSFKLDDFKPLSAIRDRHLAVADKKVAAINADKSLSAEDRKFRTVHAYTEATDEINKEAKKALEASNNNLYTMYKAGVKPGWGQLQQMAIAPMLMENPRGGINPVPVRKSYSEGLDTSGYWISSEAARKNLIEKVQSVAKPGDLSKQIMATTMNTVITANDCGTTSGIELPVGDRNAVDRYLSRQTGSFSAGTLVTPKVLSALKAENVSTVNVRSPIECRQPKGMCSKCFGVYENGHDVKIGDNIGVIAGQALGEKATQAALKTFHTGGVAGSTGKVVSSLDRVTELLKLPETVADSAVLAPADDTVKKIKPAESGGFDITTVGGRSIYVPPRRPLAVEEGTVFRKGERLTFGPINPRELLELKGVNAVRDYISKEIFNVFESEGVRKRNIEVVTRSLTNLARVDDPGDSDEFIRGDYAPVSYLNSINSKMENKASFTPVLRGVTTLPLDQSDDWIARLQYRGLKSTILSGANEGWKSDIHGLHPVPGLVYSAEFGKGDRGPY